MVSYYIFIFTLKCLFIEAWLQWIIFFFLGFFLAVVDLMKLSSFWCVIENMSQSEMHMYCIWQFQWEIRMHDKWKSTVHFVWHVLDSIRRFLLFKNSIMSNVYLFKIFVFCTEILSVCLFLFVKLHSLLNYLYIYTHVIHVRLVNILSCLTYIACHFPKWE